MNGETLPPEHGYPVRLLVPGWYGMASVKWLANIRVLEGPITKVEVSTDDGVQWHEAEMEEADSPYWWQHWEYDWETGHQGHYLLQARAVDEQGNVQPSQAQWNFRGYSVNSIHVVPVTVHNT